LVRFVQSRIIFQYEFCIEKNNILGAIVAPQIMKLTLAPISLPWLPYLIFGIFCVTAGWASFSIPDTNGKKFIQSIEEAEMQYS